MRSLPHIIIHFPSGFQTGKSTSDNPMLMYLALKHFINNPEEKALFLQVDIEKSFDGVEHKFLFETLEIRLVTVTIYNEDHFSSHLTPNVIYEISCNDCTATYYGQTNRPLIKRIKEHESHSRLHLHNPNGLTTNHLHDWH